MNLGAAAKFFAAALRCMEDLFPAHDREAPHSGPRLPN